MWMFKETSGTCGCLARCPVMEALLPGPDEAACVRHHGLLWTVMHARRFHAPLQLLHTHVCASRPLYQVEFFLQANRKKGSALVMDCALMRHFLQLMLTGCPRYDPWVICGQLHVFEWCPRYSNKKVKHGLH